MRDHKETSDLAQRLSDTCFKIYLTSFAFSAVAFALAERIKEAPQFNAFATVALSGQKLSEQLADLAEDPCWQLYSSALSDPAAVKRTTLRDISQIQCSDQVPNAVRVGPKTIVIASSGSSPVLPVTPPIHRTDLWLPLPEAEPIGKSVSILWDDATLEKARQYSVAAAGEVDHWRTHRSQLFKRRARASATEASRPQPESTFDVSNLQLADLEQIKNMS